jgi:hypothetical protein
VRISGTLLLAGAVFASLAAGVVPMGTIGFGLGPGVAQAQNLGQRVVSGRVVDADSAPVAEATVFLKNLKTKSIRSYTSDARGRFRFSQVNMAEDHELWAERNGRKSAVKTVSSWDSRKEFEVELRLK